MSLSLSAMPEAITLAFWGAALLIGATAFRSYAHFGRSVDTQNSPRRMEKIAAAFTPSSSVIAQGRRDERFSGQIT